MIDTFLKLFGLFTKKQKRDFYVLQIVMLFASVAELVGTVSIMPFMALASDPEIVGTNEYFSRISAYLGSPSHEVFLFYIGAGFVFFVVLSNGLMLLSQFLMSRYSFRLGGEISSRLYGYYLSKDIIFHSTTNSAALIQRIMRDSAVLSKSLIAPALRLNARFFSILLLSSLVIYVNPFVAIATLCVLGAVYWFIFYVIRRRIYRNGKNISASGQKRNRLLNESFGGIKDMKLYSFESAYLSDYRATTKASNRSSANNTILGEFPYYLVETAVFAGMIMLTLYLYSSEGGLAAALPILTLFAMAGMKIVPKVQQSYLAITRIRSAQPAFQHVYADLKAATGRKSFDDMVGEAIRPRSKIELRNISFGYQDGMKPIFEDFSASFTMGEMTAIVGSSGVGKSTLVDILMGLVEPWKGGIFIDGEPVVGDMLAAWRAAIGYVPQEVYLTDTTPSANIAFGVEAGKVDMERVEAAAKAASIHEFIMTLPGQYEATIGERGGQFSGGQKQRIGLARAFYRGVSVLILDEATSALDTETQSDILLKLKKSAEMQTVIMITHRAETIAFADQIVKLGAHNPEPAGN